MTGDRVLRGLHIDVPLRGGTEAALAHLIELGYENSPGLQRLVGQAVRCAADEERRRISRVTRAASEEPLILRILQARGAHEPSFAVQLERAVDGWRLRAAFFEDSVPSL